MPGAFIQNDTAVLFSTSEFGTAATYKGATVNGIFDEDDKEVVLGDGTVQIVDQPMFTGRTSDFTGIADGDTITINSVAFTIRNWQREGEVIEILLERT